MQKQIIKFDDIAETKLSAIVAGIEAIVKGFQNTVKVEIEKANGTPTSIRITTEIKNLR